jgi:hypothetical protein
VRMKFAPSEASSLRCGISTRFETSLVGSSTRPSMESHMINRMLCLLGSGFGAGVGGGVGPAGAAAEEVQLPDW